MLYLITNQKALFDAGYDYSFASMSDLKDYIASVDRFGFDTETRGFDPRLHAVLSSQFGDEKEQFVVDHSTIDFKETADLFKDKLVIMQNAKFDLRFCYYHGIVPGKLYDTFLAETVLTTGIKNRRRALDYLAKKYCGAHLDKTVRGSIHKEGLSRRVIKYAADDVRYLPEIMDKQMVKIKEQNLQNALALDNEYVKTLAYIEYSGFKLDVEKWKKKVEEDLARFEQTRHQLDEWVIKNCPDFTYQDPQLDMFRTDVNEVQCSILWSSSKQVIPFFRSLGFDLKTKDDKGGFRDSVDAKVIRPQKEKSPVAKIYLEYKAAEKVVSTYGQTFLDHIHPVTGKIHTVFTQIMDTGRLSSGKKENKSTGEKAYPNLQNIPSDNRTRSCFIVDKGNKLIVADYSGQEQIVLANQSQDKDIISFYEKGLGDMHSFVASKIYPELKDVPLAEIKKNHANKRQIAKSAGFAINYGGNGTTIAQNLAIPESQGEEVYKAYFKAFPGLDKHFSKVQNHAFKKGYIFFNNVTGRKSYVDFFEKYQELSSKMTPDFWQEYRAEKASDSVYFIHELKPIVKEYFKYKGIIERKSYNYPIQGTSADITKLAGIYMFRYLVEKDLVFKVWMPNVVHDEMLIECPEELAQELAKVLQDCMEKAGDVFCKTIKLKAEPVITDYWTH